MVRWTKSRLFKWTFNDQEVPVFVHPLKKKQSKKLKLKGCKNPLVPFTALKAPYLASFSPKGFAMDEQVYLSKLTKQFRIAMEESWFHEKPEVRNAGKRWFELIPCKGFKKPPMQEGPFIALYSEEPPTLVLYTDRIQNAKKIWKVIKDCPGTRIDFMGGETDLFFPPALLELVATMAGARKRRQLSEAQKEAMARGREKAGLVRDEKGRIIHSQPQNSTHNETISIQAGDYYGIRANWEDDCLPTKGQ
jgi:hypothetical protein